MYEAYAGGDGEFIDALVHDDIDWTIYAPAEVFPFAGSRRGKSAVLEALASISKLFELKRYVPLIVVAEGDRAAVFSDVAFVQRSTGRVVTFKVVNFLRFESERLIEFREVMDSFDVTQQALGRWLRV
jgi:ketosteroid isomerase-like protein